VRTEKYRRKATLCRGDGKRLEVNFFLRQFAEEHSGKELIIDILNSKATFIPLEAVQNSEIFFFNKRELMVLELHDRDLSDETMLAPEIQVQVELTNGEVLNGRLFVEMPQERSRVSDYLNFSPDFIYLCREEGDVILNKAFMLTVKETADKAFPRA